MANRIDHIGTGLGGGPLVELNHRDYELMTDVARFLGNTVEPDWDRFFVMLYDVLLVVRNQGWKMQVVRDMTPGAGKP